MPDKTIIYVTANYEPLTMMAKIQKTLGRTGLPIISVSHKPIDFGENICVGDVGRSGFNVHRQIAIGCKRARTKYVIWCEADTLYPPEHFEFTPPKDDRIYLNKNMWRLLVIKKRYVKKRYPSIATIISAREHLLRVINDMMKDLPQWTNEIEHKNKRKTKSIMRRPRDYGCEYFETIRPIVSVFHKSGMHKMLSSVIGKKEKYITYWPPAKQLVRRLGL